MAVVDSVKVMLTLNSLTNVNEFMGSEVPMTWSVDNRPRSVVAVIGDDMVESERATSKELLSRNFDLIVYDKRSDGFSMTGPVSPNGFGTSSGFGTFSGVGTSSSVMVHSRYRPMKIVVGLGAAVVVGIRLYFNESAAGYIAAAKAGWWLVKNVYRGNTK
ncbi:PREDICTED: uncharacterized protein LOC105971201 [Erythranthe guttata]|uniref:uncharacterized protein LOC105971201 n=1 Tax=Erythranthe guttata TaxID=4155 RepID=UPI00064DA26D|nr:PREDICTED: uncharacterized protein LOC105971201 [Erythranthe guttata]|eukprot:XP_012851507.1 PREDICTED: uncharacterized protein LOC105971201 [Erythranthe guttata]